jgi:hypothetical protein
MPARKQQTHAKRARELAVKEKRERKRAKKAEAAALRDGVAPGDESVDGDTPAPDEGEAPSILTEQESR